MFEKILKMSIGLIWATLAFILYKIAFNYPMIVEQVYSRRVYAVLASTVAHVTAHLPFSLAEFLLYFLIIFIVAFVIYIISALFKEKGERCENFFKRLFSLITVFCVIFSMFVYFWGLNYARMPLSYTMGLDTSSGYTVSELRELTVELIETSNALREEVPEDGKGVFTYSRSRQEILSSIKDIYARYAPSYANVSAPSLVKGVTVPDLMSVTRTMGIYSPFTFECNVNMQMPDLDFAVTAGHEYAHLQGFAREDEANFLAWFILKDSDDPEIRYSAYMLATEQALSRYHKADPKGYADIYYMMSEKLQRDLAANREYWDRFDTEVAKTSDKVYSYYLEYNGIDDGLKSYGRMLDLMLALKKSSV